MRKKDIVWLVVVAVLAGVYVHYFTHVGEKTQIGITASLRPNRRPGGPPVIVEFTLNNDYQLTALKVLPLDDGKFNPLATPVWDMVSDSNSVPTRAFRYGQPIRGMKPTLKGVHPDVLAPDTAYRLVVTAGGATGFRDFKMKSAGP